MRNLTKFLPILAWAGGLPVTAHALQTVDLPDYAGIVVERPAAAMHDLSAYWSPPTPWLSPRPADAATPHSATFVFVGAADADAAQQSPPVAASRTDVSAVLDELRLEVPRGGAHRGWLGQLLASLAAVGLVAKRRLLVR